MIMWLIPLHTSQVNVEVEIHLYNAYIKYLNCTLKDLIISDSVIKYILY